MARINFEQLKDKYFEKLQSLNKSPDDWRELLENYGYHYFLDFFNVVCVEAQFSGVRYCASYDDWNNIGRYVNKGSKGIAVSYDRNTVSYVFPLEMTNDLYSNRDNELKDAWNITDYEDFDVLTAGFLVDNFDLDGRSSNILYDFFSELFNNNLDSLKSSLGVNLENRADYATVREFAINSVCYSVAKRYGFDYDYDFSGIVDIDIKSLDLIGRMMGGMSDYFHTNIRNYFDLNKNNTKTLAQREDLYYNDIRESLRIKQTNPNITIKEDGLDGRDRVHSKGRLPVSKSDSIRASIQGEGLDEVWIGEAGLSVSGVSLDLGGEADRRDFVELHFRHTEDSGRDGRTDNGAESERSNQNGRNDGENEDRKPDVVGADNDEIAGRNDLASNEGSGLHRSGLEVELADREDNEKAATDNEVTAFSNGEKSFAEQVDDALSGKRGRYEGDLKVCDTPEILMDIGCRQLPILYTRNHLREAIKPKNSHSHAHGLTVELIKKVPNEIIQPVMIYDSQSQTDSIIVLTSLTDSDNFPIIVAIKPNGNGFYEMQNVESNFATSIYGRENFEKHINKVIDNGDVLYCNKEKSQKLFSLLGLQSSEGFNNLDFDIIIHQSRNIVNTDNEKNQENVQDLSEIKVGDYFVDNYGALWRAFLEERISDIDFGVRLYLSTQSLIKDVESDSITMIWRSPLNDLIDPTGERRFLVTTPNDYLLSRAKERINEYSLEEFNHESDFSDLSAVGVAYTEFEEGDNEDFSDLSYNVQVDIDLITYDIKTYINGTLYDVKSYYNLYDLITRELEYLDFQELVYVNSDILERYRADRYKKEAEVANGYEFVKDISEIESGDYLVDNNGSLWHVDSADFILQLSPAKENLAENETMELKTSALSYIGWYEKVKTGDLLDAEREFKVVTLDDYLLSMAKELITEYSFSEFGSERDFSDLSAVSVAYADDDDLDDIDYSVEVFVDLNNCEVNTVISGDFKDKDKHPFDTRIDGEIYITKKYDGLYDLITNELKHLSFDELISIDEEVLEKFRADLYKNEQEKAHRENGQIEHEEVNPENTTSEAPAEETARIYSREDIEKAISEHRDIYLKQNDSFEGIISDARTKHYTDLVFIYAVEAEYEYVLFGKDVNRLEDGVLRLASIPSDDVNAIIRYIDEANLIIDGISEDSPEQNREQTENSTEEQEQTETLTGDVEDNSEIDYNSLIVDTASMDFDQLSLFDFIATEGEQIGNIISANSESEPTVTNSIASDDIVDRVLMTSFNASYSKYDNDKAMILGAFVTLKDDDDIDFKAEYLKMYMVGRSGGFVLDNGSKLSVFCDDDGIRFAYGTSTYKPHRIVSYREAYEKIVALLEDGKYITDNEVTVFKNIYLASLADDLSFTFWDGVDYYADYLDNNPDIPYTKDELDTFYKNFRQGGHPNTVQLIKDVITSKEDSELYEGLVRFLTYKPSYNRYPQADPYRFITSSLLKLITAYSDNAFENYNYPENLNYLKDEFLIDDVIDRALSKGNNVQGGKGRIYRYFTKVYAKDKDLRAAASFLSKEYGVGGVGGGGSASIDEDHSGKGISLYKTIGDDTRRVNLNWQQAAKRINKLIEDGRYLKADELTAYNEWDNKMAQYEAHMIKPITRTEIEEGISRYMILFDVGRNELIELVENNKDKSDDEIALIFSDFFTKNSFMNKQFLKGFDRIKTNQYSEYSEELGRFIYINTRFTISRSNWVHGTLVKPAEITFTANEFYGFIINSIREGRFLSDENVIVLERSHIPAEFDEELIADKEENLTEATDEITDNDDVENKAEDTASTEAPKDSEDGEVESENEEVEQNLSNYRITYDENEKTTFSPRLRFRDNVNAIKLLKELEVEERQPTDEEKDILAKYVGWGGLSAAFDVRIDDWKNEYNELLELLTDSEYESAKSSTLTAFYTSPVVVSAMYKALENFGFRKGNILEPSCATGNFIGLVPDSINANFTGVELDSISGRIAKMLYPLADITINGYEKTDFDHSFDVAIGNVPFNNYKIFDRKHSDWSFSIHNYFFARSLEEIHSGGIVAFITSSYTLDAQNWDFRRYIAERAEFLGAIRLPNTAFKGNAGTDVVSDIIFLKKRDVPITDIENEAFIFASDYKYKTGENQYKINQYFIEHPDMILGNLIETTGQYGRNILSVEPFKHESLAESLDKAISKIEGTYEALNNSKRTVSDNPDRLPASPDIDNLTFGLYNGEIYYREGNEMLRMTDSFSKADIERLKGLIELGQIQKKLINLQLVIPTDEIERDLDELRAELNTKYDDFVDKYGYINNNKNKKVLSADNNKHRLMALENPINDDEYDKSDFFVRRTVQPIIPITKSDTVEDALVVSITEKGVVDLSYIAELTNKEVDNCAETLIDEGLIFRVPFNDVYETADEYLSGNIKKKLEEAKKAAESDISYVKNVEALEKAMPERIEAKDISVRLGSTWIPVKYYEQFMREEFNLSSYASRKMEITYMTVTNEYYISNKSDFYGPDVIALRNTYGTNERSAIEILEASLNLKDVKVSKLVRMPDGTEKRMPDREKTLEAQGKQEYIKQRFEEWIWSDPQRTKELEDLYNDLFNNIRNRDYDGSFLRLGGSNPDIKLKQHQLNAIARIVLGGNTLLAHVVGAGKTFEMVAGAMESKRLGLCHKSLFVVPNHLTLQWASEFMRLYPTANILVADKKDFEPSNRKQFCARIAMGNYDAIIMGHSQFGKIPLSYQKQMKYINEEIAMLDEAIAEVNSHKVNRWDSLSMGDKITIKHIEKEKQRLIHELDRLQYQLENMQDSVVFFEQLGVDRLFVDEAHYFKNLYTFTKMSRVAGIPTSNAVKSFDMFLKTKYLNEITNEKGVIFATGTPISNSMVEMYTMIRYLAPSLLADRGISQFDAWASAFGTTVTSMELKPEGSDFQMKTRFAKFFNLPELIALFKEFSDVKTADMLELDVPEAEYHNVEIEASGYQKTMLEMLADRADRIRGGGVLPKIDNMLKITTDGRKLALDQRVINGALPDEEHSKVNSLINNAMKLYRMYNEDKATQLIFSDISTPSGNNTDDKDEFSDFKNIYQDIKDKLIKEGVPENEIAFIHDANSEAKKADLFNKVNKGEVRFLLGSTAKLGAGTNVQARLIALHHLDVPWKPSDIEQQEGRILRQGNKYDKVHIFRYVTKGTFDAYSWQIIENKQKFISQIMTSKSPVRVADDIDETALSYAEIKALATGNPHIKEKMELDTEISKLKILQSSYFSNKRSLKEKIDTILPTQIKHNEEVLENHRSDLLIANNNDFSEFKGMTFRNKLYADAKEAGENLLKICQAEKTPNIETLIGEYLGFKLYIVFKPFIEVGQKLSKDDIFYEAILKGKSKHTVQLGKSALGNITRLDNEIKRIEEKVKNVEAVINDLKTELADSQREYEKPFAQEQDLLQKIERLKELEHELGLDQTVNEGDIDDFGDDDPPSTDIPDISSVGRDDSDRNDVSPTPPNSIDGDNKPDDPDDPNGPNNPPKR